MMNKQIKPLPILQGKTAFAINLISQVSVIVAQMVISLFLTPIVLDKMGAEAYGFVGLVNNFVSYVAVITTALNSLSGRYITIAHHSGDQESAESYYSSVFFRKLRNGRRRVGWIRSACSKYRIGRVGFAWAS